MDAPAVERQLLLPASPTQLWEALTEPDEVAAWFGHRVEWEMTPGGAARFLAPGDAREGVVDEVEPGRRLSFRWWPSDDDGAASSVTYEIDPDGDGCRLTVRETPAAAQQTPADPTAPTACADARAAVGGDRWTAWDTRGFHLWARAATTVGATA